MTLTASETCYHCLHADFKAEANGTMRGFARCTPERTGCRVICGLREKLRITESGSQPRGKID